MQDIIKKFKFKGNGVVLNAPTTLKEEFVKLGFKTTFDKKAKSTNTLLFVNDNEEYLGFLKTYLKKIEVARLWAKMIRNDTL